MPGPKHSKLNIPDMLYHSDITRDSWDHLVTLYNSMIQLYDELDRLKQELEQQRLKK